MSPASYKKKILKYEVANYYWPMNPREHKNSIFFTNLSIGLRWTKKDWFEINEKDLAVSF